MYILRNQINLEKQCPNLWFLIRKYMIPTWLELFSFPIMDHFLNLLT